MITLSKISGGSDSYPVLPLDADVFFRWLNIMNIVLVNEVGGVGLGYFSLHRKSATISSMTNL